MKVAVTGASGFLGGHVLRALLGRPEISVVAVTRQPSRIQPVDERLEVVQADLAVVDGGLFDRLGRPDVLIHLAWDGLPNYKSLHHIETELPRQYKVLSSLVRAGLPALWVAGTCFEYGMQSGCLAEDTPTAPSNPYGLAKDSLRRQLEMLAAVVPFKLGWARFFYMYGDGQAVNSLYPSLRAAAERGDAAFPMSGGEQLRDFLPAGVAAGCLARLATGGGHGLVNVCSGAPVSVRSLVERWISENGWSIRPEFGRFPYPDYEPMAFWGNARRLELLLSTPGVQA